VGVGIGYRDFKGSGCRVSPFCGAKSARLFPLPRSRMGVAWLEFRPASLLSKRRSVPLDCDAKSPGPFQYPGDDVIGKAHGETLKKARLNQTVTKLCDSGAKK